MEPVVQGWVLVAQVCYTRGVRAQDDLEGQRVSGAALGLDAGLEELLLAMQKNVTNQARTRACCPRKPACHHANTNTQALAS